MAEYPHNVGQSLDGVGAARTPATLCRLSPNANHGFGCRGAVLLEVLISLGLMIFGLAVVGLQISTSLETARKSRQWTTGVLLTETKMAELLGGAVEFNLSDAQIGGDFGIRYPGYSWRVLIEPCEVEEFFMLRLQIGYNPSVIESQIANPDMELDFDDPGNRVVGTAYRLVPKPIALSSENSGLPPLDPPDSRPGDDSPGGGPPQNSEYQDLADSIRDFIANHPDIISETGGINLDAVKRLPREDLKAAMAILQPLLGTGSGAGLDALPDQIRDAVGDVSDAVGEGAAGGQPGSRQGGDLRGGVGGQPGGGGERSGVGRDRSGNGGGRNAGREGSVATEGERGRDRQEGTDGSGRRSNGRGDSDGAGRRGASGGRDGTAVDRGAPTNRPGEQSAAEGDRPPQERRQTGRNGSGRSR